MSNFRCLALLFVAAAPSSALGQPLAPAVAAAPVVAAPAPVSATAVAALPVNVIRSGTPIALRTLDSLSTKKKKVKVGDRFQLEVADALVANGLVVIPSGSKAVGEVTMVKNKGMWGKRGRLSAHVISVRVGERTIRLTGAFDESGSAGTAGVVGAAVFVPIAGFFISGTSAEIPAGTKVAAFLDEDLPYVVNAPVAPTVSIAPAGTP